MASPSPEELYDRYRRRGDVRALTLLFDLVSPELFPLALRLSEDAASAEDALQDTWLAALEAEGEVRSVMPWLVGILKNKVKRIRRAERRMPPAGTAFQEILVEEPVDAAQREEALRAVRGALDDLPETYREVAVLRWRYGLDPAEIADARGIPPGTVRSLLSRAAEKLRTRLGALTIVAGISSPHGLPQIRKAILAKAGAGAATTAAVVTGALVMSKKIVIAVVAVLALAAGWTTFSDRDGGSPPPPVTPTPELAASAALAGGTAGSADVVPAGSAPVGASANAGAEGGEGEHGTARVAVTWSDGTPAAGVFVRIIAWDGPDPLNRTREVRTDPSGRLTVAGLAAGRITAYIDRGGSQTATLEEGGVVSLTLTLREGTDVSGVVVGPEGVLVEGADIWLSDYGNHTEGRVVATSGPGGTFGIRSVGTGHYVGARAAGYSPSGLTYVSRSDGERVEVRLVLHAGGCVVEGIVLSAGGGPVQDARVRVGPASFQNVVLEDGTAVPASPALEVRTDAEGAFRVEGVPPGTVSVLVRAGGLAPAREGLELEPGARATLNIELQRGVTVTGVVLDAAGRTVPGAKIAQGSYAEFLSSYVHAGPDGSFRLDGLPVGAVSIGAGSKGLGVARLDTTAAPGQVLTWNPVLRVGDGVSGTVVDETGVPRVGWLVSAAERTRSTSWRGQRKTGADGGFEIPNCPSAPLRLDVFAPDGRRHCLLPSATVLDPVVGGAPLRIVVPEDALPSAFVTGALVDPTGAPVGDASIRIRHLDTGFSPGLRTEKDTGRFRSGPLPPGAYAILLDAAGWPQIRLGERTLFAGQELSLGRLQLEAGGELIARVEWASGEPIGTASAFAELIDARGTGAVYVVLEGGVLRSGPLVPGAYVLRVQALKRGGSELAQDPVVVRAGEKVELDLSLEESSRMALQVFFPEEEQESATARVLVRDQDGNLVRDMRIHRNPGVFGLSLLPGHYTAEAVTPSGLRAEATIEVAPAAVVRDPYPVVLRLR